MVAKTFALKSLAGDVVLSARFAPLIPELIRATGPISAADPGADPGHRAHQL